MYNTVKCLLFLNYHIKFKSENTDQIEKAVFALGPVCRGAHGDDLGGRQVHVHAGLVAAQSALAAAP